MAAVTAAQAPPKAKRFYFDIKWVVIIAIVAFLVIFEVLPMLYLVVRAFTADGGVSFHAFQRVYTYPMNWTALRNTVVTAWG